MKGKIFAVHPSKNLLEVLIDHLIEREDLSSALVLFPNRRPIEFFKYYLSRKINAPVLLPELRSFEDWFIEYSTDVMDEPDRVIEPFEQAWFIYRAVCDVYSKEGKPTPGWGEFLPWALRLADVFRELDMELVEPHNLLYPPTEALEGKAVELLQRLANIYQRFNELLDSEGLTTEGRRLRRLVDKSTPLPEGPVYIAGFYALTRSEDALFRRFFEKGALFYWHTEVEPLPEFYQRWFSEWHKRYGVELEVIGPDKARRPEFYFYEAHDLHSELAEMKNQLQRGPLSERPDHTAVVLASTDSLIPVLHYLPDGPVNITMGYPLRLSGPAKFLEKLFELVLKFSPERGFITEELIELLKSPYIGASVKTVRELKNYGAGLITEDKVLELAGNERPEIEAFFEKALRPLVEASTLRQLAGAVKGIFEFMRFHSLSPFEKEAIATVMEGVVYRMENFVFSDVALEKKELFELFIEMLRSTRVPFEGEPLTGLQVMGLLETRLLSFERVMVIDVNEGVLPKVDEINPLLPQKIRMILGLPDYLQEEAIIRYHFERLLNSAKEVHLFWQYCTTPGEVTLEGKKVRSRYVEKLIWEIEKTEKKLFDTTEHFKKRFKKTHLALDLVSLKGMDYPEKTPELMEGYRREISSINPTLLEDYITCPLRFFYSQVLKLKPPPAMTEVDQTELGTVVHEALEQYFREKTGLGKDEVRLEGVVVKRQDLNPDELFQMFKEKLRKCEFYRKTSPERKFFLEKTAEFRFKRYLEQHPDETGIVTLEKRLKGPSFDIPGLGSFVLEGKVDRIDHFDGTYNVLDYKTGRVNEVSKKCLALTLDEIKGWPLDDRGIEELHRYFSTLQLPFYIYLWGMALRHEHSLEISWDSITAGFVKLGKDGEIEGLYPSRRGSNNDRQNRDYNSWFEEVFPEVIRFIVRHIFESPHWYPTEDKQTCKFCDYRIACRFSM